MIKMLRTGAGVVIGYLLMVLLITLVQEVWFGGVSFGRSSVLVLLVAGPLTIAAAMAGGMAGTAISGLTSRTTGLIMSVLVCVEMFYLVATGRVAGPLWFDLLGAAGLVAGILLGSEIVLRKKRPAVRSVTT